MRETYQLMLENEEATLNLGRQLGQQLPTGTILLLNGELGAGKTSLVQGIGLGLGITEAIVSPTFTLVNEYHEGRIPLYHLDLYRLETQAIAELYLEQYWDGKENPLGLVAIEWAERLQTKPLVYLEITLRYANFAREAIFSWQGKVHFLEELTNVLFS